jgi:hypothetical protein
MPFTYKWLFFFSTFIWVRAGSGQGPALFLPLDIE